MNKEDILNKAQQEKNDEREEQIRIKAFKIGWISVSAVMLLLIFFRFFFDESSTDILMILSAQTAAVSFYQYFHIKDKKEFLFTAVVSIVAFFLCFAALLSDYGVY